MLDKNEEDWLFSAQQNSLDHAQLIFDQGVELHRAGHLEGAVAKYKECLKTLPNNPIIFYHMGLALHNIGRFDEAIINYQKATELQSDNAELFYNLATAFIAIGSHEEAVDNLHIAIALNPGYAQAHLNLGNSLYQLGRFDSAVISYQQAIATKPDLVAAYCNLGKLLTEQKRPDEGVLLLQKAVAIDPQYAEAHCNLGNALYEQGRYNQAIASLKQAFTIKPNMAQAYFNIGISQKALGDLESAVASLQKAVTLNPNYHEGFNSLGLVYATMGNYADAILNLQKAITIKPDYMHAYYFLGYILKEQGQIDAAVATYKKAIAIKPDVGLELTLALTQSPIAPSKIAITRFRNNLQFDLIRLQNRKSTTNDPYLAVGTTNFYTAYHALNDKTIQQQIAEFCLKTYPMLGWSSNIEDANTTTAKKIKIGILSTHLYNHTIGSLNLGIIEHLNRDRFEVIIFRPQGKEDSFSKRIDQAADRVVPIKFDIQNARQTIAAEKLSLLYYPDIGMNSFTYFMAFNRLAPVQCTTFGHPVTTGIPNMDYFISSHSLEPENAQEHYSEELYLMHGLPCYYQLPKPITKKASRTDYDLPKSGNIYLCPQSLFKIHPDFDETIMEILQQDPNGWLVLIEGGDDNLITLLKKRWDKLLVNKSEQIIFLPRMSEDKYAQLFGLADVVLDTFHFSGGKTTSQAIALGVPVITLPGAYMRGRVTFACYKIMGVMDLVAQTPKQYVDLAHRLINDQPWRRKVIAKISSKAHLIMENRDTVKEFAEFFSYAVAKSNNQ
ncbi:MAG: tetratricopeptide repeat protein [Magnetococcales bacterium]|nr:tetratricopeptide repeat protein [Magnetococcales bacterium]